MRDRGAILVKLFVFCLVHGSFAVRSSQDGVSCLALHEEPIARSSGSSSSSSSTRQTTGVRRKMLVATGSWDAAVKVGVVGKPEAWRRRHVFEGRLRAQIVRCEKAFVNLLVTGADRQFSVVWPSQWGIVIHAFPT